MRNGPASATTDKRVVVYSEQIVDYVLQKSVAAVFPTGARTMRGSKPVRSVVLRSIRASMCVPLRPKDEVIGVLYVDRQQSDVPFTDDDLELFMAFGSQAAVAIENAALYARLKREIEARMQLVMEAKLGALGAVVAGIAHELRNPLNLMINFADASSVLATELQAMLIGRDPVTWSEEAVGDVRELVPILGQNADRIRGSWAAGEHDPRRDASSCAQPPKRP